MVLLQHKRDEMLHYLSAMADLDYQVRVWVHGEEVAGIGQDCLGYALTFFYEDTMLFEAPERNVGTILASAHEAACMNKLATALGRVLKQLGEDRHDSDYIACPHWRAVVSAAQEAVITCTSGAGV